MRNVKLTQDLYPRTTGDVITVDDVSAARVVEAKVGVYLDDEAATESDTDALIPTEFVEPKLPKPTNGRTASFD